MLKWLINLITESDEKKLKKMQPLIDRINSLEPQMKDLSDEDLAKKTPEFKQRIEKGESLDDILPEAFAVVREASVRMTGLRHFDVQLLGAVVLYQGKIAEMKTGEGKTLAATMPIYLNALTGKGSHVVTVNDYLARRDSEWMGPIYKFLGLEVGVIQHDMDYEERKKAYSADVTYGTNNEFGFDYLRDNMSVSAEQCVQRDLHYAIVDEVDSILVDEARTPLIISGVVEGNISGYFKANEIAKKLAKETDFIVEEKTRNAVLTEPGVKKVEKLLGVDFLFDVANMDIAHQILQSIKARHLYKMDIDYVIKEGQVIIVDEFTGRLMIGRRYSDGLHQAIEAKENVRIQEESQTLATITFQNYFRMYEKLAGMTGTAKTEEPEFIKIYGLEVLEVPTHKPMIRKDNNDVIYKTKKEKFTCVADDIEENYRKGRPVLVGTISIENSELLSSILQRRGVPHHVLNAKHHEKEAEIIAKAGQKKGVTIATNMAGRGTDIVLGEGIAGMGGLHVIGTERHESRRIDNQLRGRSGRQGDPGSSRFYVSLEDDLMRMFGSDRIANAMTRLGVEENTPIEHGLITRAIENAQNKVEAYHFNIRKQVLEFDDVMNRQRDSIYTLRHRILKEKDLKSKVFEMMEQIADSLVENFMPPKIHPDEWDHDGLVAAFKELVPLVEGIDNIKAIKNKEEIKSSLVDIMKKAYELKEDHVGFDPMREIEKLVMLKVMDQKWIEQLHNMDALRDGIGLRGYGGKDPLVEYKFEGYTMFQEMMDSARQEIVSMIFKVQVVREGEEVLPKRKKVTYGEPSKVSKQTPETKAEKTGRNDPCPCGSGKKYKKCCGKNT
ncbi:preprotein translocase subunit SecA [Candidatus Margulisiibacteriota bacterium]